MNIFLAEILKDLHFSWKKITVIQSDHKSNQARKIPKIKTSYRSHWFFWFNKKFRFWGPQKKLKTQMSVKIWSSKKNVSFKKMKRAQKIILKNVLRSSKKFESLKNLNIQKNCMFKKIKCSKIKKSLSTQKVWTLKKIKCLKKLNAQKI